MVEDLILKGVDVHVKDKSVLLRVQLMTMIISDTSCGGRSHWTEGAYSHICSCRQGLSSIHYAACGDSATMVEVLVSKRADVNMIDG